MTVTAIFLSVWLLIIIEILIIQLRVNKTLISYFFKNTVRNKHLDVVCFERNLINMFKKVKVLYLLPLDLNPLLYSLICLHPFFNLGC